MQTTLAGQWHHAVRPAKLGYRHDAFSLTQDSEDLLVFIQNLLIHLAEKILLMRTFTIGGNYPEMIEGFRQVKKILHTNC